MKAALLLAVLAVMPFATLAKKAVLPIELIALQADIIVRGEIIAFDSTSYEFKVTETIKGTAAEVLTVRQFEEWECDVRYAKVEKGRQLILFLRKDGNKLKIVNGSTGEIPVTNGKVTLKYEFVAPGGKWNPQNMSVDEFTLGIKQFTSYFEHEDCDGCYPDSLIQTATEAQLKAFSTSSQFATWLYTKITGDYKIIIRGW